MISAVMVNLGISESLRSMCAVMSERTNSAHSRESGNPEPCARDSGSPLSRGRADEGLNLGPVDLVPQCAVLALVGRPDLLLRHLAEFLDLGLDHHHAERLELRLCLGEVVDRLGRLADLDLRFA